MTQIADTTKSRQAFYESLPQKRMGAGCLFCNEQRQILLVQPSYKPTWEIPGGIVEADESPLACAQREVKEELGVQRAVGRLLVVDYTAAHGIKTESLMFVFWGGLLTAVDISHIELPPDELLQFAFFAPEALPIAMTETLRQRVLAAWRQTDQDGAIYLEAKEG